MLIVPAHELVPSRNEQRHVVNLGARLIESFAQVLQLETKSTVVVAVMRIICPCFISADQPELCGT
jgi:hypothetical protein